MDDPAEGQKIARFGERPAKPLANVLCPRTSGAAVRKVAKTRIREGDFSGVMEEPR